MIPPRHTFFLILLPMLATFLSMRLFLHLVRVQHIYVDGHILHHLFSGALIVIVAAFVLAFDPEQRRMAILARVALGVGSAMVLDEVVYLVMTKASDDDYISRLSLFGGAGFVVAGAVVLWLIYRSKGD